MCAFEFGIASATPEEIVQLAARHGLDLEVSSLRFEDAGLDYRVAFARGADGADWVLRIPRRRDVSEKLDEERRILAYVGPRLSVAVPRWAVCTDRLVAYRRLPGEPGLTLDRDGQPVWHIDPSSPEFAAALGRFIAELQALNRAEAASAGVPFSTARQVRSEWRGHLESVRAEFDIAPGLDARFEDWLARDELWPEFTAFTHGELYAAHVLIDTPGRIVGVLDWTTAKVGDPATDFTVQLMMGSDAFHATVRAYLEAGGASHPNLAERCAELAAAAPLLYGAFALKSGVPEHRAAAAAQLGRADE